MRHDRAFRVVRALTGQTQKELAALLDVGPSQISLIESGNRTPSGALISKLCERAPIPSILFHLLAAEDSELEKISPSDEYFQLFLSTLVELSAPRTNQLPFTDDQ